MDFEFLQELIIPAETKIAMVIMDGLGGLPFEPGGKTELETAHTPNLDALAAQSALGLTAPLGPGITVESGPGHLAIFGYDPIEYRIGRGILEAVGIEFDLGPNDVAARGNFCSVDVLMPRLLALKPDVVIVSGDHSTPAVLKAHSWHPVPTLLYAQDVRADGIAEFGERVCARGSLGVLPAQDVMPIALANAHRIEKFSS